MPEQHLPDALYTAEQVREFDRIAIEQCGIAGIVLMKRAGRAIFDLAAQNPCWAGKAEKPAISILCGTGNNGGDGFIVAGLAAQAGWQVQLILLREPSRISGDALLAFQFAEAAGVEHEQWSGQGFTGGLVVDALFGTGLARPLIGDYLEAVDAVNRSGLPVIAADIPSGLCSNSGQVLGAAIDASQTVSFIGLKRGLFTGRAADFVGELYFDDLSVPGQVFKGSLPLALRISSVPIPRRAKTSHKGSHGHVLLVGGNHGMGGALALAAMAAGRSGAGLISCATRAEQVNLITGLQPELMTHAVPTARDLRFLAERATVLVIGPGLGQDPWAQDLLAVAASLAIPQVWDADALNLLARFPSQFTSVDTDQRIITPHPGEAARLLGCSTKEVEADRFAAARNLQALCGGTVLLKGAGTVITAGQKADAAEFSINTTGSPAMASGGMGDLLSGLLGALLAQGFSPLAAAQAGAFYHGLAGERAGDAGGQRGTLASDLLPQLRGLLNER